MDKGRVAKSFGDAAKSYDAAAYLQREVGNKLLELLPDELDGLTLDLGAGTGAFTGLLKQRCSKSGAVVALDLSTQMNLYAKNKLKESVVGWITGDAETLPIANGSINQIYASLSLQWCYNLAQLFSELRRVLAEDGTAYVATLGPNTLHELKHAWKSVDNHQHVNSFLPVDDWLHAAKASGFSIEQVINYPKVLGFNSVINLMKELKAIGAHNVNQNARKSLTGKSKLKKLMAGYEQYRGQDQMLPATYDLIFLKLKV